MAQVTVMIDGKAYRMACEEGQQAHLESLALRFDRYVSHLKSQFGEIGDLRVTVMAGIMVMDELSEVSRRLSAVEAELAVLRQSHDGVEQQQQASDHAVAAALSELASRLNGITAKLNARPTAPTN
ncbi:cell division protein ZapA [Rhizobium sp. RU35A]|uniref:Cell division protein ZapA n=1 Tax=Rhizobium straminoryzae TaxID=1387186 RepID=A0A549T5Y1_9HYPH|nr:MULTISPECIES: cell division protein ZapA [Rhizobium]TRL37256.1 cell division protein ZapA [Rhizobium straminoryzae]SIQ16301.1 cell division protein ZapA [Rhizobium sp. RU35A]